MKKFLLILWLLLLAPLSVAWAATLQLATSASSFGVGDLVTLTVTVNTGGAAINAVEGTLKFPTDLLEVVSINKDRSILPLWVEGPSFSNTAGEIVFNGGIPNPGYSGLTGQVLTVIFRAKQSGSASIVTASSAVRANDGQGTDVLTVDPAPVTVALGSGTTVPLVTPIATAVPIISLPAVPATPKIVSKTHPSSSDWYSATVAELTWSVPSGVTAAQTLLGSFPNSVPYVNYQPAIASKTLKDLTDGTWYFHLRFQNAAGWGGIAHFPIKIDTTAPKNLRALATYNAAERAIDLNLSAEDTTSGIAEYQISVGSDAPVQVAAEALKAGAYRLAFNKPGQHEVIVRVIDRAGNAAESELALEVPLDPAPTLDFVPTSVPANQEFTVTGRGVGAGASVSILAEFEGSLRRPVTVVADDAGAFTWTGALDRAGHWQISAEVIGPSGPLSARSVPMPVEITDSVVARYGPWVMKYLSIIIPVVGSCLLLVFVVYVLWYGISVYRYRVRRRARVARDGIHRAFGLVKEDLTAHLSLLQSARSDRSLSKDQEVVVAELERNIDALEKYVAKQIERIEKGK